MMYFDTQSITARGGYAVIAPDELLSHEPLLVGVDDKITVV